MVTNKLRKHLFCSFHYSGLLSHKSWGVFPHSSFEDVTSFYVTFTWANLNIGLSAKLTIFGKKDLGQCMGGVYYVQLMQWRCTKLRSVSFHLLCKHLLVTSVHLSLLLAVNTRDQQQKNTSMCF